MTDQLGQDIAELRAFNRVYTRRLGLLETYLDESPFTLSEARILYEIKHRSDPTAADISRAIDVDRAQISRTIKRFTKQGLVTMRDSPSHGRHQLLSLTAKGRAAFSALNDATHRAVGGLLDGLPLFRRHRLLAAAKTITGIFEAASPPTIVLRTPQPGDMATLIGQQAAFYAREHGYDRGYEALVTRILADFQQSFDPGYDAAWIAEVDGRVAGSVFLMQGDGVGTGLLRLLYITPEARGLGIGKQLITACIEQARSLGYRRLQLWTDGALTAARALYERAGFVLIEKAPHNFFGTESESQTWVLEL